MGGISVPHSTCSVQNPSSAHWPCPCYVLFGPWVHLDPCGPTYLIFLAGWGRRSHFNASEIMLESIYTPPTWCLYDIKLCAIYPEVWGCLGYIACWHSFEKCVRGRNLILMQSCLYYWLGWILNVSYPLNHAEDFPWGWLTGAPQERGTYKKIILTRIKILM